ncbi:hypothetical protein CBR_g54646 [Chara braunii]|uniref:Uncharacterized protein n=1 Tax=Chara braunii TaxID=69332 RepID=A0A388MCB3_CHABU|nr:hypothetical protein CBR_g54646 [Chara braunii]|eukprot:GBG92201.1 hypothetical protein CBR_g54646 [Chara braunii]
MVADIIEKEEEEVAPSLLKSVGVDDEAASDEKSVLLQDVKDSVMQEEGGDPGEQDKDVVEAQQASEIVDDDESEGENDRSISPSHVFESDALDRQEVSAVMQASVEVICEEDKGEVKEGLRLIDIESSQEKNDRSLSPSQAFEASALLKPESNAESSSLLGSGLPEDGTTSGPSGSELRVDSVERMGCTIPTEENEVLEDVEDSAVAGEVDRSQAVDMNVGGEEQRPEGEEVVTHQDGTGAGVIEEERAEVVAMEEGVGAGVVDCSAPGEKAVVIDDLQAQSTEGEAQVQEAEEVVEVKVEPEVMMEPEVKDVASNQSEEKGVVESTMVLKAALVIQKEKEDRVSESAAEITVLDGETREAKKRGKEQRNDAVGEQVEMVGESGVVEKEGDGKLEESPGKQQRQLEVERDAREVVSYAPGGRAVHMEAGVLGGDCHSVSSAEPMAFVSEGPSPHKEDVQKFVSSGNSEVHRSDTSLQIPAEVARLDKEDVVEGGSNEDEGKEEVSTLPSSGADADCYGFTQSPEDGVGTGINAAALAAESVGRSGLSPSKEKKLPSVMVGDTANSNNASAAGGLFGLVVEEEEEEREEVESDDDEEEERGEGIVCAASVDAQTKGKTFYPKSLSFAKARAVEVVEREVGVRSFPVAAAKVEANGDSIYSSYQEEPLQGTGKASSAGRGWRMESDMRPANVPADVHEGKEESPPYQFERGKRGDDFDNESEAAWLEYEDDDDEEVVLPAVLLHSDTNDLDDHFEASSSFEDLQKQLLSARVERSTSVMGTPERSTPVKDKYAIHDDGKWIPTSSTPEKPASWQTMLRSTPPLPPQGDNYIRRMKSDARLVFIELVPQETGYRPEGWNRAARRDQRSMSRDSFIKSTIVEEDPRISPATPTNKWKERGEQGLRYAHHAVMEAKTLGQQKVQEVVEALRAKGATVPGLGAQIARDGSAVGSTSASWPVDTQNALAPFAKSWRELSQQGLQYASYWLQEAKTQGQQTIRHAWQGIKTGKEAAAAALARSDNRRSATAGTTNALAGLGGRDMRAASAETTNAAAGLARRDWRSTATDIADHVESRFDHAELRRRGGGVGLQHAHRGIQHAKTVGYHGLLQARVAGYQGLQQARNVGKENLARTVETLSARTERLGNRPERIGASLGVENLRSRGGEVPQLACREWLDLYARTRRRIAGPYEIPASEEAEVDTTTEGEAQKQRAYSPAEKEGAGLSAVIAILLLLVIFLVLVIVFRGPCCGQPTLSYGDGEQFGVSQGAERMCRCTCDVMKS